MTNGVVTDKSRDYSSYKVLGLRVKLANGDEAIIIIIYGFI